MKNLVFLAFTLAGAFARADVPTAPSHSDQSRWEFADPPRCGSGLVVPVPVLFLGKDERLKQTAESLNIDIAVLTNVPPRRPLATVSPAGRVWILVTKVHEAQALFGHWINQVPAIWLKQDLAATKRFRDRYVNWPQIWEAIGMFSNSLEATALLRRIPDYLKNPWNTGWVRLLPASDVQAGIMLRLRYLPVDLDGQFGALAFELAGFTPQTPLTFNDEDLLPLARGPWMPNAVMTPAPANEDIVTWAAGTALLKVERGNESGVLLR